MGKGKSGEMGEIEESKTVSIHAGMLDDVIKDFKITRGALAALTGTFDSRTGDTDYWEQVGKLDAIEVVLNDQGERLQGSIEELCRLAGRPVYPEDPFHQENP